MPYTRRRFIEAAGALAAAGLARSTGVRAQSSAPKSQAGAPGVDLNVDGLPDYSRDLERYLIRLANDARERRKRVINAISTRQGVVDRQKAVVAELWKM